MSPSPTRPHWVLHASFTQLFSPDLQLYFSRNLVYFIMKWCDYAERSLVTSTCCPTQYTLVRVSSPPSSTHHDHPMTSTADPTSTSTKLSSTSPSAVAAATEAHAAINEAAKVGVPVSDFDPDALSKGVSTKSPMSQIGSVLKESPPNDRGGFQGLYTHGQIHAFRLTRFSDSWYRT